MEPTNRSLRWQRPLSLTILVLAPVSSMNTSRAGSNMNCSRLQRRIRALRNQSQQFFRVLLQPRSAPSCGLGFGASGITPALQPFNRGTRAQTEALGSFPPRRSRFDCSDHAFPQIIGIWLWHRLGPQNDDSIPSDSSISALLGIPPIQLNRNML